MTPTRAELCYLLGVVLRIFRYWLVISVLLLISCTSGESPVLSSLGEDHFSFNCTEITSNTTSPLGTNLIFISDYNDSQWLFVDAFIKSSSTWFTNSPSSGFNNGQITTYSATGWPTGVTGDTQIVSRMFAGSYGQYPAGTYVIYWEGSGATLSVEGDATNLRCEDGGPISTCATRRGLFDVNTPSDEGMFVYLTPDDPATYSPASHIRDIRVIMPGGVCGSSPTVLSRFEYCATSRGGQGSCGSGMSCQDFDDVHWNRFADNFNTIQNPSVLFHPFTMRKLRKYRSIRYQELLHMQGTPVTDWNSRKQKEDHAWTGEDGVPPEIVVYMSNLLNADAWINIPHMATDDYVTSFATFMQTNLAANLDVYLEYSNEPWNPDTTNFPQSQYFLDRAIAGNIGVGDQDYIRKAKAYVERAVEIFGLWNPIFGAARTTRLISSWGGFNDVAPAMLDHPGTAGNVDAIAVGPYIGIYMAFAEYESVVQNWTKETVFREIEQGILNDPDAPNGALASAMQMMTDNAQIANTYGVRLLGYESGGHLWAAATESNPQIRNLFREVVYDSRFGTYYQQLYNHWRSVGGELINNFAFMFPHRNDQFGTLPNEYARCQDFPKDGGVNDFIINNDCWWTNCAQ